MAEEEPWDVEKFLLPEEDDQRWLVEQLASLVRARGHEHLLLAPLLEPDETYFPDPWQGGALSLERLMTRLCVYADLEEATIELKIHPDDDVGGQVSPAGIGAAIWLVRRQGNTLHYAARASTLRDPGVAVPAAARAIAEGWRRWHGLSQKNAVLEQRLVDVTSIYLGFGILTTTASVKHGATRTDTFRLQRTKQQLGVLGPKAMSYALGVQLLGRQADPKERKRVRKLLPANQKGFLDETLHLYAQVPGDLIERLGIPPRERWGEPPDLADLTAPFASGVFTRDDADTEVDDAPPPPEDKGVVGMNEGKPVFRVQRSKALRLAKMLAMPVGMLGMLAGRMNMGVEIDMAKVGLIALGLGALGLIVGRFLPDSRCSEPKCGTPLKADDKVCPRCGGTISGVISHPKERLAAEEALATSTPAEDA
ncbi:MAG: zinc ribbon domain-containing protein [Myxococcota bacterium]